MRAGTWLPEPNSRIRSAEIHLLCHRYGTKTNCIPKINELGQQIQTRAWATQRLLSLNFGQGYINGFLLCLGKVISGSSFNGFFIGGWRNWFFGAFLGSWFWRPSQQNYRNWFLRSMFAELISKNFPAELIFGKLLWRFEFNSHLEENYFQSFDSGTLCIKAVSREEGNIRRRTERPQNQTNCIDKKRTKARPSKCSSRSRRRKKLEKSKRKKVLFFDFSHLSRFSTSLPFDFSRHSHFSTFFCKNEKLKKARSRKSNT